MTILPFLGNSRKKRQMMAQEMKEFSELVKDQYTFLMQQLEKVLKDYFDLSSKVKEMHAEIFSLRGQLTQAAALQCSSKECVQRVQVSVSAILSCRPFFILIFLLCIKMKHYGFSRKSIWKNLETFP